MPRLYTALAATDTALAAVGAPGRRWRLVTKSALMPILAADVSTRPPSPRRRWVLTALAASWVGDVALLRGQSPRWFAAGAGAFGVAHAAYLGAVGRPAPPRAWPVSAWLLAGGSSLGTTFVARRAHPRHPMLSVVVLGYAVLLTTTALATLTRGDRVTSLGGALFLISDATLGIRVFVLPDDRPLGRVLDGVVMATYTAAQFALTRPDGAQSSPVQTVRPRAAAASSRRA